MMRELEIDEPFEVMQGCPTVCFKVGGNATMLPWSAFSSARISNDRITLEFGDRIVTVEGNLLEVLWRLIQLQDVREVKVGGEADAKQCRIEAITIGEIPRLQDDG
ncbi:hypothetical protein ACFSSA_09185 [Luteolibacter algae]|uniref:Uncharacterized protein n=1 Tax=Luteolibacter algae TaxID=454151 RepID=A0ABW5D8V5_9BACT